MIKGMVKNIADFGAFIDLGGIDGLLHITDMCWGRINHPSDMVKIDQEIEVKVLSIDKDKEKIALGLKQKEASPWENIEQKYPVSSVHEASVVNIMSYGAFCKLEEGVEGLVHISEMSWTKRINHPSEMVTQDQKVKVKVLEINKDKQEIWLGMKQVGGESVGHGGGEISARARWSKARFGISTNYGTFVEIEEGIDGLLHVSDLCWTKKVAIRAKSSRRARACGPWCSAWIRKSTAWHWASSRWRKTRGRRSSRPTTIRAWWLKATSRRSPTSACSWNWSRAWKACCTSAKSATRRSRSPKISSRSGRKWKSRSFASISTIGRSVFRSSGRSGRGRADSGNRTSQIRTPRPSRWVGRRRADQRAGGYQDLDYRQYERARREVKKAAPVTPGRLSFWGEKRGKRAHYNVPMNQNTDPLHADRAFFEALIGADTKRLGEMLVENFVLIDVMSGSEVTKEHSGR